MKAWTTGGRDRHPDLGHLLPDRAFPHPDRGFPYPDRYYASWEFWPARLFEAPYYATLLAGCALRALPPLSLARANWALDHGEIGIGSKFATQQVFAQDRFPATELLRSVDDAAVRVAQLRAFGDRNGWPVIVKPDQGAVGKGIRRIAAQDDHDAVVAALASDHLLQAWCPLPAEFGVFWRRERGDGRITGINGKHFPTVVGDGVRDLDALARAHPRFTAHWQLFLPDHDLQRVPEAGEAVRLSFVGSHTMGCRFSDDSHLQTPALLDAVRAFCDSQPGYNFGRLDVRCDDAAALQRGDFVVIEANGVASLPTHMFDPRYRPLDAWRIFCEHGAALTRIAAEHRDVPMALAPLREIVGRVGASRARLDAAHSRALDGA